MSGRPAAATYLTRVAQHFEGEKREHVLAAAAAYGRATEAWETYTVQLGRELPADVDHGVAWSTAQYRTAGAAAVAEAARHERVAIAELEAALTAEGVTTD
jgi:hypothetical protein